MEAATKLLVGRDYNWILLIPANGQNQSAFVEGYKHYHRRLVKDVKFDATLTLPKKGG